MHNPHYPIHLHWSEEEGEWVATSPALEFPPPPSTAKSAAAAD